MLKISGSKITINRGDSAYIEVNVYDNEGQPYELKEGDSLWFAAKEKATDSDYAIAPKRLFGKVLSFEPEDTEHLDFGAYIYDVRLIDAKGRVSTIIQPSTLNIEVSITGPGDLAIAAREEEENAR